VIAQPQAHDRALPTLGSTDPIGNILALLALAREGEIARIGPVAPDASPREPVTRPWLSHEPTTGRIGIGAAVLQAPLFEPASEAAQRFAGLGALLAHEMNHALTDGLEGTARAGLESRTLALAAQYDAFIAVGDLHVDGLRTAAENLADLSALEIAFEAFAAEGASAPPDAEGRSASQRFFLAWAQAGRRAVRDEVLRLNQPDSPRAPPRWRIDGPVANLPAFAAVFACPAGEGLARPEAMQVGVWR